MRATISTVTQAASSYDLTDLATVKAELQITDTANDTWLASIITRTSAAIANYCNNVFPVETIQDVFYLDQDAGYRRAPSVLAPLQASRWPLITVASVTEGAPTPTTLIAGTDYTFDAKRGQLLRFGNDTSHFRRWTLSPVTAIYTAGYATIPADVVEAALRMIVMAWSARKRDPLIKAEDQPGIGRVEYWVTGGSSPGLPSQITDLLDNYRVPVIA